MIFLGIYGLGLLTLIVLLFAVAILWKQRFSPFLFGAGIALVGILAITVRAGNFAIYNWTGVNFYVAVMIATALLFTGGLGLVVKCSRRLIAWFNRRHAGTAAR